MNAQLSTILKTQLPTVKNHNLRSATRKEWAAEVRKLLKSLNINGVSVTTPSHSMAQAIQISLPDELDNSIEHQKLHDELWKQNRPGTDCPQCGQRWNARKHLEAIILAAFPDLDDRSDLQSDCFDYCLSFS
jgi:hypothetical protein